MSRTRPSAPSSVRRAIARSSFCMLATSTLDQPHAVGVLYTEVDGHLYISTQRGSKKARNIAANPRVAVCIPARRYPFSPPFLVQFGASARLLDRDDPHIVALYRRKQLKKITAHGELDDPDVCFLQLMPDRRVSTYGIGLSLLTVLRDPIHASRTFDLEPTA